MKSYITGSRAYGQKYMTENSDIDMVLVTDTQTIRKLYSLSSDRKIMIGNINFVCFNVDKPEDMERYNRWKLAHDECVRIRPANKQEAIEIFRKHDAEASYKLYARKEITVSKEAVDSL